MMSIQFKEIFRRWCKQFLNWKQKFKLIPCNHRVSLRWCGLGGLLLAMFTLSTTEFYTLVRAKVYLETVGNWNLMYDLPLSYSGALCGLIQFTSIPVWLVCSVYYCSIWISGVNNIMFNCVMYGEVYNYSYLNNRCNYVFPRICRFCLFFCCRLKSCDGPVLVAQ